MGYFFKLFFYFIPFPGSIPSSMISSFYYQLDQDTALTLTLKEATSNAAVLVIPITACLDATYGANPGILLNQQ